LGKEFVVKIPKNIGRITRDMPWNAVETFKKLVKDIRDTGPVQPRYRNYCKLGEYTFHCHLAYSWVACWRCEQGKKNAAGADTVTIIVEVEYVGSREKAPY
jgi:hypothetical protein